MKAVLLPAMFFVVVSAERGLALPSVVSQQMTCDYKPSTKGNWENRGSVDAQMAGDGLYLNFIASSNFEPGMNYIVTTNTDSENEVRGRCQGSVTLSDTKNFKIRDFRFDVISAEILSTGGRIELKAKGQAIVNGSNQSDSFDKAWTINKTDLDSFNNATSTANPFSPKQESQTVCGQQLTLRFDELSGMARRDSTPPGEERFTTEIRINKLHITFDPC